MAHSFETIKLEHPAPHILVAILDRPAASNALNTRMAEDLLALWDGLTADAGGTRAVVLTGAGTRAFCAGADLKERLGMSDQAWQAQHLVFERMMRAFIGCPVPVIGAVNGAAYGGGFEMVLACDFAYAAESARFALPEASLGIMPGAGGTQTLPRAAGERRAKEIMLTGVPFGAHDALAWGLVNRVTAPEALMDAALETARRIAAQAPLAVRQIKHAGHLGLGMDLASGMLLEIEAYNRLVPTDDRREGIAAFNEKRKPKFEGR